ncbi:MAG: nitroreductase family protein [Pseudomonadales bacterium]|nr:nitroreductase family protein [Pseudomonadales bacterium]MDP6470536.1 nitroreductase family protein [Pseudomonadales bacterium]MDP6827838.1 nitroreductase family protein [Pseudomonadales bacterium]MDP6972170.1 nitroreductase family protein [Pseudomonadales bacterium]
MELYDAMSSLRAVRRLRPDPIPDLVLRRVLTAATWAPTGGNMQPWRIVLVREGVRKQRLEDLYRPHWEAYLPGYAAKTASLSGDALAKSNRAIEAGNYLATHLHQAPAIAVFCFNPQIMTITDSDLTRPSVVGGGSLYPAVQNLLLACRNEGLGCVLTTLLCIEEDTVRELLELPDGWYTCAHVPIGYPVGGGYGAISRRSVDEMVFEDAWGDSLSC